MYVHTFQTSEEVSITLDVRDEDTDLMELRVPVKGAEEVVFEVFPEGSDEPITVVVCVPVLHNGGALWYNTIFHICINIYKYE